MKIIEELQILSMLTKESSNERIAEVIRKIVDNDGETIYQVVLLILKERLERGHSKKYSLRELGEKLPWRKSTLIEKMQKMAEEGIIIHEKRKYKINMENEVVKRIWNYFNDVGFQEKNHTTEIQRLKQCAKEKEKTINTLKGNKRRLYREISKKEMDGLIEGIIGITEDSFDPIEEVINYIEKNILEVLGYKEAKEG